MPIHETIERETSFKFTNYFFGYSVFIHLGFIYSAILFRISFSATFCFRIFNYGNTSDYAAMVKDVVRRYRNTRIVVVGFSMGGNLVTKYIGEPRKLLNSNKTRLIPFKIRLSYIFIL